MQGGNAYRRLPAPHGFYRGRTYGIDQSGGVYLRFFSSITGTDYPGIYAHEPEPGDDDVAAFRKALRDGIP